MRIATACGPRGLTELCVPICAGMWSVTPYARCDIRCVYCCTGAPGRSEPVAGLEGTDGIRAALAGVPADDLLILGAFSDAYPNVESTVGLTRRVLGEIVRTGRRLTIVTKGVTVLRDLDLLRAAGDRALVQVSVCTTDEESLRRMEPDAPSGARRLAVIAELAAAGVPVELNALPWIPGISDTEALLDRLPPGVRVNLSPLATGGDELRLLQRTFRRSDVWEAYFAEYRRLGHLEHTSWIEPSLPPDENHPLARLPRLAPPVGAR